LRTHSVGIGHLRRDDVLVRAGDGLDLVGLELEGLFDFGLRIVSRDLYLGPPGELDPRRNGCPRREIPPCEDQQRQRQHGQRNGRELAV
jgi:hypothetical protein